MKKHNSYKKWVGPDANYNDEYDLLKNVNIAQFKMA